MILFTLLRLLQSKLRKTKAKYNTTKKSLLMQAFFLAENLYRSNNTNRDRRDQINSSIGGIDQNKQAK